MIQYLDKFLPVELSDKIYRELHRSIMNDICEIIDFKIVFIVVSEDEQSRMSWLVCEQQNYYYLLDDEIIFKETKDNKDIY